MHGKRAFLGFSILFGYDIKTKIEVKFEHKMKKNEIDCILLKFQINPKQLKDIFSPWNVVRLLIIQNAEYIVFPKRRDKELCEFYFDIADLSTHVLSKKYKERRNINKERKC